MTHSNKTILIALLFTSLACLTSAVKTRCTADICAYPDSWDTWDLGKYFTPTCGYKTKSCTSGTCDKTFNSVCQSCANKIYPHYEDGPCESEKTYCDNKRPTSCSSSVKNVCAYFTGADGNQHYTTVKNSCNACKDKSVQYYLQGACGSPLPQNETYCLPNSRPTSCGSESKPVCGFYKNSDGTYGHKVISNVCNACKDKKIVYTTPGACVFWCDRNPWLEADCAGTLTPICGSYKEKGVAKKVSLRNSCLGCYYVPVLIDSYTEGLCPGDNGILCKNNGGAYLEGQFGPVCGLTTLTCSTSSCRKSYPEAYTACGADNVVKYLPGLCPGDIGISCDGYRPDQGAEFTYENVCGYTSKTCKSNSCRANYSDQFEACSNSKVLYFGKGPC